MAFADVVSKKASLGETSRVEDGMGWSDRVGAASIVESNGGREAMSVIVVSILLSRKYLEVSMARPLLCECFALFFDLGAVKQPDR